MSDMPPIGLVRLASEEAGVTAMERTHYLARTIGAPDLAPGFLQKNAEEGKAFPATHSASHARALGEGARQQAKKSLERRKVPGWCAKGHELTPENMAGRHCRTCKNHWAREHRKLGLAA